MTKKVEPVVKIAEDRITINAFTEEAAAKFNNLVFKVSEKDDHEPIIIYIDSYGGYVDGLMSMISVMDSVPNPFITVATGKAMSAGAVLLSHGDIRCIGKHARVMLHEMSAAAIGNINDIKTDTAEHERLNDYLVSLLAQNCKKTSKQLRRLWGKDRDLYMNAKQSVEFGIADHIGIPIINKYSAFDMNFLKGQG